MARVTVEVCFVRPDLVDLIEVSSDQPITVGEAIGRSGLLQRHPQIDLATYGIGRFGRSADMNEMVRPGDRIEIYRPLSADPKERRRQAARRG